MPPGRVVVRALPGVRTALRSGTVAVLRDGVLLGAFRGMMAGAKLDELVGKMREIDMDASSAGNAVGQRSHVVARSQPPRPIR